MVRQTIEKGLRRMEYLSRIAERKYLGEMRTHHKAIEFISGLFVEKQCACACVPKKTSYAFGVRPRKRRNRQSSRG